MTVDPATYRPEIQGWSEDILPWYAERARELPDGSQYVEVGIYHGRSLLFLTETLWDLGKAKCAVRGIDQWSYGLQDRDTFASNVASIGPAAYLIQVDPRASIIAAADVPSESCDLVFLDGDHFYLSVLADIRAWAPKVKPGGILSGHDYGDSHPGVKQAVDEFAKEIGRKVLLQHSVWRLE